MSTTYSYLKTTLDAIRLNIDEASTNGKYSDTVLLRNVLRPSIQDVMHRVHNSSQLPVVCRFDFTMPADQDTVTLPPCISQIWSVWQMDSTFTYETGEVLKRHDLDSRGFGYRFEGNSFKLQEAVNTPMYFRIYYVHSGSGEWHYGGTSKEGTAATSGASVSTFTMNASPTFGVVDKRINAYAGQIVRCFPSTGMTEERTISSYLYTSSVYRATLANAFDIVDGTVEYEIVPPGPPSMWDAVTYNACIRLGTIRSMTQKQMAYFHDLNRAAMKTLLETVGNFDGRNGKSFTDETKDTRRYLLWG